MEYQAAWDLQNSMAAEVAAETRPPTLLLLEHPHTYTFGRRGQIENLLWDEAELARRGIAVHWVDRGGDVTYHGPGQLVGYPLLPLGRASQTIDPTSGSPRLPQADYVGYLRRLELALILALANLGLPARQVDGLTGVWVSQGLQVESVTLKEQGDDSRISILESPSLAKIAAIGVKVDANGVTRHGFALNVAPDMSYWEGIIACGLVGHCVTSLAEVLEVAPPMAQVMDEVVRAFAQTFGYEIPGFT
jgi:lipoate-protein ligase B